MLLFIGFVALSILSLVRQFKVGILSCLLSILLFASLFALNFSKKWKYHSPPLASLGRLFVLWSFLYLVDPWANRIFVFR